jgi:hypothetical protein
MQIGSRWRSPLSVGVYDDDNGTLAIDTHADQQVAALQYADDYLDYAVDADGCKSAIDVSDGVASVSDKECTLTFKPAGDGIDAAGSLLFPSESTAHNVSLHLSRRAPDALKGVYSGDGVTLTVESSGDDQFTFSLTINGREVATNAHATTHRLGLFTATTGAGDCTFEMSVGRRAGNFRWFVVTDTGTAACAVSTFLEIRE